MNGDKMKSKYWIIILILIILGVGGFFLFNFIGKSDTSNKEDYRAERTKTAVKNNTSNTNTSKTLDDKNENTTVKSEEKKDAPPKETEISTFSTPIVTQDAARQNNVSITCSTLNDTVVKNGETFSFCNTVGQATTDKGYQKAEIFDAERK